MDRKSEQDADVYTRLIEIRKHIGRLLLAQPFIPDGQLYEDIDITLYSMEDYLSTLQSTPPRIGDND